MVITKDIVNDLREKIKSLKPNYDVEEVLVTCLKILFDIRISLNSDHLMFLSLHGLLKRTKEGVILLLNSEEKVDQQVIDINLYRDLFKGIRNTSKGNKKTVLTLMQEFLANNPEYTFDDCVKATQQFIESQIDKNFIPNADNFILTYKQDKEVSMLEIALENYQDTNIIDDKWL